MDRGREGERERDRVVKESAARSPGEREEERQQGKVKRTSFLRQQLDCFVVAAVAVTVCLFSYSFILHLSFAFSPSLSSPSLSVSLTLLAAVNLFNLKDSVCSLASL